MVVLSASRVRCASRVQDHPWQPAKAVSPKLPADHNPAPSKRLNAQDSQGSSQGASLARRTIPAPAGRIVSGERDFASGATILPTDDDERAARRNLIPAPGAARIS